MRRICTEQIVSLVESHRRRAPVWKLVRKVRPDHRPGLQLLITEGGIVEDPSQQGFVDPSTDERHVLTKGQDFAIGTEPVIKCQR